MTQGRTQRSAAGRLSSSIQLVVFHFSERIFLPDLPLGMAVLTSPCPTLVQGLTSLNRSDFAVVCHSQHRRSNYGSCCIVLNGEMRKAMKQAETHHRVASAAELRTRLLFEMALLCADGANLIQLPCSCLRVLCWMVAATFMQHGVVMYTVMGPGAI